MSLGLVQPAWQVSVQVSDSGLLSADCRRVRRDQVGMRSSSGLWQSELLAPVESWESFESPSPWEAFGGVWVIGGIICTRMSRIWAYTPNSIQIEKHTNFVLKIPQIKKFLQDPYMIYLFWILRTSAVQSNYFYDILGLSGKIRRSNISKN